VSGHTPKLLSLHGKRFSCINQVHFAYVRESNALLHMYSMHFCICEAMPFLPQYSRWSCVLLIQIHCHKPLDVNSWASKHLINLMMFRKCICTWLRTGINTCMHALIYSLTHTHAHCCKHPNRWTVSRCMLQTRK
jgi:hypothetical protein